MSQMDSKYHVGDSVHIINTVLDIDMFNTKRKTFFGVRTEIQRVQWCDMCHRYEYRIKGNDFLWCDDNFEFDVQQELPEFNTSEISLESLFS